MTSSLIPEKPLLVSPSLAATIGLEEATMLHILNEFLLYREPIFGNGYEWITVDGETLSQTMPFWSDIDIQRISKNLRDKGIILIASAPYQSNRELKFALNEKTGNAQQIETPQNVEVSQNVEVPQNLEVPRNTVTPQFEAPHSATQNRRPGNTPRFLNDQINPNTEQPPQRQHSRKQRSQNYSPKSDQLNPNEYIDQIRANVDSKQAFADQQYSRNATIIPPNWWPSDDVIKQIAMKGISKEFAISQVPEFITYWTERREAHFSWGSKFVTRVNRQWIDYQSNMASNEQAHTISAHWHPSEDAIEILVRINIPREFIEDAVPEFVLYWKERGDPGKIWNSKFISHVKLQWARFTTTLEHNNQPSRIPPNWQPSVDVYDVLKLANIDLGFSENLVKEFVIFWQDSNEMFRSWNTKFLQHVKYHWAKRHNLETGQLTNPIGNYHAQRQNASGSGQQQASSTFERLTDRSWAENIKD